LYQTDDLEGEHIETVFSSLPHDNGVTTCFILDTIVLLFFFFFKKKVQKKEESKVPKPCLFFKSNAEA
jgi:hypothetical protein